MSALFQGALLKLTAGCVTIMAGSYIYKHKLSGIKTNKVEPKQKRDLAKERRNEWREDLSRNIAPPVIKCNYYPTRKN